MKKKFRRGIAMLMVCVTVVMFVLLIVCTTTENTWTGWVGDKYIHKTKSAMYDRGEPTKDAYRWKGNKLYYFCHDGHMLRHSTKYIKLNRNDSVKYIYIYISLAPTTTSVITSV